MLVRARLWIGLLFLLPGLATAQERGRITGTVTDIQTADGVPGVNVVVVETGTGTTTGPDGTFALTDLVPGTYAVRATIVGYEARTKTVRVRAGEPVSVDFRLTPERVRLHEVVVTGVGRTETRAEASVAVPTIEAAEITEIADVQSVTDLLQGRVAGLTVNPTSGNVGSGVRFTVRSGVSLNSDGRPLIFIDGARINTEPFQGFGVGGQEYSPLADLDPESIESIQVLRGPSAAALYGTDGSDGVILIDTKAGRIGQDLRVDYEGTMGFNQRVRPYSDDIYKTAADANALFRRGQVFGNRVSVSAAYDKTNVHLSYANRRTDGILRLNEGAKNIVNAHAEFRPTPSFDASVSAGLAVNRFTRPSNDLSSNGQLGNTLLARDGTPYRFLDSTDVFSIDDQQRVQRFRGSVTGAYTPTALDGLHVRGTIGGDVGSRRQDRTFPATGSFSDITQGERAIETDERRQYNGELLASYQYDLRESLTATSTVGGQAFTESVLTSRLRAQELGSDLITDIGAGGSLENVGEARINRRSAGLLFRQEVSLRDRYFLSGSVRRDYSSRLVAGETGSFTVWYPSVRGTARLAGLDPVPNLFSQLKVRAAFGQTGALPDITASEALRLTGERSGFGTGATVGSVGDPGLRPERVSEFETGIDVGLQENRYSLSATYYYQTTRNSIVDVQPAPSTGFGAFRVPKNVGTIRGQGVETAVEATLLDTDRHRVRVNANYAYRYAEVTDLDGQSLSGVFGRNVIQEGREPYAFTGVVVDGAARDQSGAVEVTRLGDPVPNVVDQNGDGVIDGADRVQVGDPIPDHVGGFGVRVQLFDHLHLGAQAEFRLGHEVFNWTEQFAASTNNHATLSALEDRFRTLTPGTAEYQRVADRIAELNSQGRYYSNFVYDADWLKLRTVSVRYDFASHVNRLLETPLRTLSLSLSAQNLFTITRYPGPDPEVNATGTEGFGGSDSLVRGQDFATLQTPRQFTATLHVGF
jgi:TonB-dependent SusC/RagA subfamily outer membrane receptor